MATVQELVTRLRTEFLNDRVASIGSDYAWPEEALVSALNAAEKILARRLLLLSDSLTPAICNISIAPVDLVYPQSYALSRKIVRIDRLKFPGVSAPLSQVNTAYLDAKDPGWDEKDGTPEAFVLDYSDGMITFNRRPTASGTATMTVKRLPLSDLRMTAMDIEPEVVEYDDELCYGALENLYLLDDKRTYDPVRAGVWGKKFTDAIARIIRDKAEFGNPSNFVVTPEVF